MCIFFTQKDLPASQKTEILHEKWQKNDKKRYQKEHPAPQKLKFCMKKKVFFYSKKPPSLAKNKIFAEKKYKKMTKNWPKKADNQAWNLKFCMKNLKSSYLWGFWKKILDPHSLIPNFENRCIWADLDFFGGNSPTCSQY